ncbi:hypothetical protein DLAC_00850 [Tieghemostelium lacteum]|uniref:F-box domain-containing protein n=1 Tax=Tieghemostelium lacteum TaxID=361077 RepID=A0A152A731_TIELA|nr:hypothetical protein DLAC_00850 [Tieghemostelium lacteum]|eukprot:KYR02052.1 hypothetical protein DLAC_00850 [Tieghemostelium lacteum]
MNSISISLPHYVIIDILKHIICSDYVPTSYKISLATISKFVFEYLKNNFINSISLFNNVVIAMRKAVNDIDRQLSLPGSLLKIIKIMEITQQSDHAFEDHRNSLNRYCQTVEQLNITYAFQAINKLPITKEMFPKLEVLDIQIYSMIIKQDFQLVSQFPLIRSLKFWYGNGSDLLKYLISILDVIKPTLTSLKIVFNNTNGELENVAILKNYLTNYKSLDILEIYDYNSYHGDGVASFIKDLSQHITHFSSRNYATEALYLLENSDKLQHLNIIIKNDSDYVRLIDLSNQKKNFRTLELIIRENLNNHGKTFTSLYQLILFSIPTVTENLIKSIGTQSSMVKLNIEVIGESKSNIDQGLHHLLTYNRSLTSLHFDQCNMDESVSEDISKAIANHPTLESIRVHVSQNTSDHKTKLFKHLHLSISLISIMMEVRYWKITDYQSLPKPNHPFIELSSSSKTSFYFIKSYGTPIETNHIKSQQSLTHIDLLKQRYLGAFKNYFNK